MGIIFLYWINVFFLFYTALCTTVYALIILIAVHDLNKYLRKRQVFNVIDIEQFKDLGVTIIVPAYNEVDSILKSIENTLYLNYPNFTVIVVNDGSSDGTAQKVIDNYSLENIGLIDKECPLNTMPVKALYMGKSNGIKLVLIDKENGGKSDALNVGINYADTPLYLCCDADSLLQNNSVHLAVMPFYENDTTIATGGNIRIGNTAVLKNGEVLKRVLPRNSLVYFQILEYVRTFITARTSLNHFNVNMIISGAFSIFRKDIVIAVGGYNTQTVGEDMELVVKLHYHCVKNKIPYNMEFVPDAHCWTDVPESVKDLKSQRVRWQVGFLQSMKEVRKLYPNIRALPLTFTSIFYYGLIEKYSSIINTVGLFAIVYGLFLNAINIQFAIVYFLFLSFFATMLSFSAVSLEYYVFDERLPKGSRRFLIIYGLLENFGYRQMCDIFRIIGTIRQNKYKKTWTSLKRNIREE